MSPPPYIRVKFLGSGHIHMVQWPNGPIGGTIGLPVVLGIGLNGSYRKIYPRGPGPSIATTRLETRRTFPRTLSVSSCDLHPQGSRFISPHWIMDPDSGSWLFFFIAEVQNLVVVSITGAEHSRISRRFGSHDHDELLSRTHESCVRDRSSSWSCDPNLASDSPVSPFFRFLLWIRFPLYVETTQRQALGSRSLCWSNFDKVGSWIYRRFGSHHDELL